MFNQTKLSKFLVKPETLHPDTCFCLGSTTTVYWLWLCTGYSVVGAGAETTLGFWFRGDNSNRLSIFLLFSFLTPQILEGLKPPQPPLTRSLVGLHERHNLTLGRSPLSQFSRYLQVATFDDQHSAPKLQCSTAMFIHPNLAAVIISKMLDLSQFFTP